MTLPFIPTLFIEVAVKLFLPLEGVCMPVRLPPDPGLWNRCTFAKSSVLKTLSVVFMVCSIFAVDTYSRRTKFPELPFPRQGLLACKRIFRFHRRFEVKYWR